MAKCLVSFGANIGNAANTIREASDVLKSLLDCGPQDFRVSRLFRTPPVGGPAGQPPFVNAVAAIETHLSEWHVWDAVRHVEKQFGRERNLRWEARKLDLDILLYDQVRVWTPHLKIPHPRMCMRRFILVPACDVAEDWIDPASGMTVGELASRLQSGPASLCVIAPPIGPASAAHSSRHEPAVILEEVARLAVAQWRLPTDESPSETADRSWVTDPSGVTATAATASLSPQRWVELRQLDLLHCDGKLRTSELVSDANLFCVLAGPTPSEEVAWEDLHRRLARKLGLDSQVAIQEKCGSDVVLDAAEYRRVPIVGPRYLLASDDRDWAIHELVSALEAMDCPVEPIPSSKST